MIEIAINDEIIQVNEELSIGQYQKFWENQETYKNDKTQMLSLFLDIPLYKLKDLPYSQIKFVNDYITKEVLKNDVKDETHFMFNFEGVTYGLDMEIHKISWGAWVDLEVYSSKDIEKNIHKIMAILYRPIKSTDKNNKYTLIPYKSEEVDDRSELFKKLPISYWFGCSSFFLLLATKYTNNMENSLNTMKKYNRILFLGWRILPKWIRHRIPLDSILISPFNSGTKTLRNSNK